jgi:hypothetical protein
MRNHSSKIFTVALFALTVLSSCNKTEVTQDVYVDSYIHSFPSKTGTPVYAIMHTAYSFSKISSVNVKGTISPQSQLIDFSGDGLSFYNKPDSASYKQAIPSGETITYNVVYDNGNTAAKTDIISSLSVAPVQQMVTEKTATDIKLSWKAATNAEAYKVRLFSEDASTKEKKMIYETNFLVPKDNSTDLSIAISLISLSPYLSTNLTFEVSAFIFETGQDTYQSISAVNITGYFGD